MPGCLRVLAAVAEDEGSVPSPHVGTDSHMVHINTYRGKTLTYTKHARHDGAALNSTQEAGASGPLWTQGQPNLQKEFQQSGLTLS